MPQVKNDNVVDGFYKNTAVNAEGQPRPLSLVTVSFKPGQVRFVPARMRLESRSVNNAFEQALASGNLIGPTTKAEELTGAALKASELPADEPSVVEDELPAVVEDQSPVTDDPPPADDDPVADEPSEEPSAVVDDQPPHELPPATDDPAEPPPPETEDEPADDADTEVEDVGGDNTSEDGGKKKRRRRR